MKSPAITHRALPPPPGSQKAAYCRSGYMDNVLLQVACGLQATWNRPPARNTMNRTPVLVRIINSTCPGGGENDKHITNIVYISLNEIICHFVLPLALVAWRRATAMRCPRGNPFRLKSKWNDAGARTTKEGKYMSVPQENKQRS